MGLSQSNTECVTPILCIYLRQNHRGRAPANEYWVFGMVDTSVTQALGVVRAVPDRSAATLLPIIQQNIAPGTIVWSDEWAAYKYSNVSSLPNVSQHMTL